MPRRPPSVALVVDTNIVIALVFGAKGRGLWDRVQAHRHLLVSVEAVTELMSVIWHQRDRFPHASDDATSLLRFIDVPPPERYAPMLQEAASALRNAVASRNGSEKDAHILALAWAHEADIWSHDRDFAGTGWPSWSNANLASALADEAPASAVER